MSDRAEYVAGLNAQRENLARRPDSPVVKRRLAEVDAELDGFKEKPVRAKRETAVPKDTMKATSKPAAKATASKPAAK